MQSQVSESEQILSPGMSNLLRTFSLDEQPIFHNNEEIGFFNDFNEIRNPFELSDLENERYERSNLTPYPIPQQEENLHKEEEPKESKKEDKNEESQTVQNGSLLYVEITNEESEKISTPGEKNLLEDRMKDENEKNPSNQLLRNKRGRKSTLNPSILLNKKVHDSQSPDNIIRKIQVHYLSFIEDFFNQILEGYGKSFLNFLPISYDFKKNVSKKFVNELKKYSIADLFQINISSKFKNYPENYNRIIFQRISDNYPEIAEFFKNHFYLDFFEGIYYSNKRDVDLREYGLEKTIHLNSEICLYQNLLDKISGQDNENVYKKKIKECVEKDFLGKPRFNVKKH